MTNLEAARNLAANFPTMRLLLLGLLLKFVLRKNPRTPAETSSQLQAAGVVQVAIIPTVRLLLLDMPVEGV